MAEVTIHMVGHDVVVRKIVHLESAMPTNIKRGFQKAGVILTRDAARRLSGPSHSKGGGSGNPYPGRVSGQLSKVFFTADEKQLVVSPGPLSSRYAAVQALSLIHI